ncbi:hypothetical protein, partial [Neisseria sp. SLRRB23]|uniref:hypothetical protein n=1 Tax=Neisseria sp. SLRRB23 TaxID=3435199 RepID=UPI003D7F3651
TSSLVGSEMCIRDRCFSPDLFLKIGADGTISTEPMKGTAPILGDDHRRIVGFRTNLPELARCRIRPRFCH